MSINPIAWFMSHTVRQLNRTEYNEGVLMYVIYVFESRGSARDERGLLRRASAKAPGQCTSTCGSETLDNSAAQHAGLGKSRKTVITICRLKPDLTATCVPR